MSLTSYFEYPLSERVRNFLRIDYLFTRFNETVIQKDVWAHHSALFTLFEIMEAAARAELKLDILQELERQKIVLSQTDNLTDTVKNSRLSHLQQCATDLQSVQKKFGQHLRENEWLMNIKQRMFVPGGSSPFDLPSYFYWQQRPFQERQEQLNQWIQSLLPTYRAINLLLTILRNNSWAINCSAEQGNYQHNSLGRNTHLLAIEINREDKVIPEVSANKYFTHIRFLQASQQLARGKITIDNISFKLIMCSFDPKVDV